MKVYIITVDQWNDCEYDLFESAEIIDKVFRNLSDAQAYCKNFTEYVDLIRAGHRWSDDRKIPVCKWRLTNNDIATGCYDYQCDDSEQEDWYACYMQLTIVEKDLM